jgi:hypothetical protein
MQKFTGEISDMEFQLQDMRNKYEIEAAKVAKLGRTIAELKEANEGLSVENGKLKGEVRRIEN